MSSVVPIYFVDSRIMEAVVEKFSRLQKKKPTEIEPLRFMRMWYHGDLENLSDFVVVRRVDALLNKEYGGENIIPLLRKALRDVGSNRYVVVEVSSLRWNPTNLDKIEINEIEFPVSSIRVEETYSIADDLNLDKKRIVKAEI